MKKMLRKSGIDIIGDVLWGTHLCQFYQTKKDLKEVLVPYFTSGLKQNEFCLWITSEPPAVKEAEEAMREALPDFDQYLKKDQMEIINQTQWYLKDGVFNLQRILDSCIDKLNQAKAQGYDGMRVAGHMGWLEQNEFKSFIDYERTLDKLINNHPLIALCYCSLDRCGVSEFLEVVKSHQYALIKKDSKWDFIQSSEHILEHRALQESYEQLEKRVEQETKEPVESNKKLEENLTDLKQVEEALQESEERFRTLFETASDVIVYVNTLGKIIEINQKVEDIFGYKNDEVKGKNFAQLDLFRLKDAPKILKLFKDAALRGEVVDTVGKALNTMELVIRHKDGREVLVETSTTAVKKNGKLEGFLSILRDITERKKAREILSQKEERYRELFNNMSSGVAVYQTKDNGKDFIFTDFNRAGERIEKVKKEKLIGKTIGEVFSGVENFELFDVFNRVWKSGKPEYKIFTAVYQNQKAVGWRENYVYKLPTGEIVSIFDDITERKKAEEALQKSAETAMEFVDFSPDKDIFDFICQKVKEFCGEAIVGVNSIHEEENTLTIHKIMGIEHTKLKVIEKLLGRKVINLSLSGIEEEAKTQLSTGRLIKVEGGLYRIFFKKVPQTICQQIEKLVGLKEIYSIGLRRKGKLFGNVTILSLKDTELNKDNIETFINQASIVLERKQAEDTLKGSEEKFRSYIENAPDGVFVVDKIGRYLEVNEAACRITGYPQEELLKKSIPDMLPPESQEIGAEHFKRVLTQGHARGELLYLRKDGSKGYWSVDAVKVSENRFVGFAKDVTKRKRAEESLRESEERYRTLLESSSDSIYVLDPELRNILVNKAATEFVKMPKERLLGNKLTDVLPGMENTSFFKTFKKVMETREPDTITDEYIFEDGRKGFYEVNVTPVPQGILCISRDITERKKAEEALQESERKYRSFVENFQGIAFRGDVSFKPDFFHGSVKEITGYTEEDFKKGKVRWDDIIHQDDLYRVSKDVQRIISNRIPLNEREYRIVDKYGKIHWIRENMQTIFDDFGEITGSQGTIIDITERKKAEEALRESEEKYRCLIERANDGIAIIQDIYMKYVNPSLAKMLGYTVQEIINTKSTDYPHPDEVPKLIDTYKKRMAGEDVPTIYETMLLSKDGKKVYVEINVGLISYDGKPASLVIYRDITERKKAEKALRKSEERYRTLLESSSDSIYVLDPELRNILVNKAATEFVKMPKENLLGNKLTDVFPGIENTSFFKIFRRVMETREPDTVTDEYVFEDGRKEFYEVNVTPVPEGILCISRDITERKKAEEVLRNYQFMVESANDVIFFKDLESRYVIANAKTVESFGLPRQEVIGKNDFEIMSNKEEAKKNIENDQTVFKTGKPKEFLKPMTGLDGKKYWFHAIKVPQFDDKGNIIGLVGIARDITEHKLVEEEIRRLSQYLESVIDNASVWLDVLDEKANVIIWNKAAEEISGFSREEVIGHGRIWEWLYPEEKYRNEITTKAAAIIEKGEVVEDFETIIRCKNGDVKTISWNSRNLLGSDGNPIGSIALGRDITERKKLQQQLIQSEKLASVGTLAYGIAHEFNNILAGILSNAQLGLDTSDPNLIKECFEMIEDNTNRASNITHNLLAFAREKEDKKESTDITGTLKSVLSFVDRELEKANIEIVEEFKPIPEIFCDPGQFSEVFLNMLTNARDAMSPKGGRLTIKVDTLSNNIRIIFKDTGCGIPDNIKGRIFEPFVTTKGALGGSEIPGTGLGLFLTYGIVNSYQGEIEVESKVGRGTQFTILIPISKNLPPKSYLETGIESVEEIKRKLNILLVDDEVPVCNTIKKFLEFKGHRVKTSLKAKEGLKLFHKEKFDLVLSDITMPDMDGIELIKRIKTEDKKTKIIVLTGHILKQNEDEAKEAGAEEVLIKPFRNELLYRTIAKVISS